MWSLHTWLIARQITFLLGIDSLNDDASASFALIFLLLLLLLVIIEFCLHFKIVVMIIGRANDTSNGHDIACALEKCDLDAALQSIRTRFLTQGRFCLSGAQN